LGLGVSDVSDVSDATTVEPAEEEAPEPGRGGPTSAGRAFAFGVIFLVLAAVMILIFGLGTPSGEDATFVINPPDPAIELPDIEIPARATALVLGVVTAVLGVIQLVRGFGRRTYLVLGLVLLFFIIALLAWAAADATTNVYGLIKGSLRRSIPIAMGALAGVLCERSGVINISIEGMMLSGAFTGAIVASASGNLWVGLIAGVIVGLLLGAVLAGLSINFRVDQIIGGTFINIFALGMTSYLTARVLVPYADLNEPGSFSNFAVPGLSEIPIIGPLLFDNTVYVYLLFILVAVIAYALFRTRWGLRTRSVGEHPRAADTVGIDVWRTRWQAVLLGGAVAGLAGTFFTLDSAGNFQENMTAGKGFIALAALIFGRWHPVGAFGAALVFGFAEELQGRLAILQTPIPSEFLLMTPYIVTIFVVAGLVGRARPPAADGQPYVKQ
jgi:general nucleoside transport system permease protein